MGMKLLKISKEDRNFLRGFIREQLTFDVIPSSRADKRIRIMRAPGTHHACISSSEC
jgi:hypothetical protein